MELASMLNIPKRYFLFFNAFTVGGRKLRHVLDVRHASFMVPGYLKLARKYRSSAATAQERRPEGGTGQHFPYWRTLLPVIAMTYMSL